jgi:hypothetical protein
MFRTVFPSIIWSSGLYIQQQIYVKQVLLPAASGKEMELQFHLVPISCWLYLKVLLYCKVELFLKSYV